MSLHVSPIQQIHHVRYILKEMLSPRSNPTTLLVLPLYRSLVSSLKLTSLTVFVEVYLSRRFVIWHLYIYSEICVAATYLKEARTVAIATCSAFVGNCRHVLPPTAIPEMNNRSQITQ
jgi:hypothetical protein